MRSKADENWSKVSQLPEPPVPDYMLAGAKPQ
jgi:hypothetical protein